MAKKTVCIEIAPNKGNDNPFNKHGIYFYHNISFLEIRNDEIKFTYYGNSSNCESDITWYTKNIKNFILREFKLNDECVCKKYGHMIKDI